MGKLKLPIVFVAAAIVSGSVTLAPKVHAFWMQIHAVQCVPYQTGFGFWGPMPGDMWVTASGVANTSEHSFNLICPAFVDNQMYPPDYYWTPTPTPIVHATFERWYPASQQPRIQACGTFGCTGWYYGDPALNSWAVVNVDVYAGPWRPWTISSIIVGMDATNQDWGKVMFFDGYTVGNEPGFAR
jgi:hypothetical protein